MKKQYLFLLATLFVAAITSCKKEDSISNENRKEVFVENGILSFSTKEAFSRVIKE